MSEMAPEPHTTCQCGRPTRDGAWICDTCGDQLTQALSELPWLTTELNTTLTGTKGIDYRRSGGTPSSEPRLPIHLAASELLTDIHATLTSWVRFCHDTGIRHQSPTMGLPADNIPAMTRYLMWRVDGLTLHDIGPDAHREITGLTRKGTRLIDRPADKWYAGPCDNQECRAELYATTKAGMIKCRECRTEYDVAARRAWLLASAEDILADATTIATAVSWLGGTPVTAARLWKWKERGRIVPKGHDGHKPLYRVGDVLDVLATTEKVS